MRDWIEGYRGELLGGRLTSFSLVSSQFPSRAPCWLNAVGGHITEAPMKEASQDTAEVHEERRQEAQPP